MSDIKINISESPELVIVMRQEKTQGPMTINIVDENSSFVGIEGSTVSKVTTGSVAPTNPKIGDLWIQT